MLPPNYQCEGQTDIFSLPWLCGKTYPEPLVVTTETTSVASSKSWQESKTLKFQYLCLWGGGDLQDLSEVMASLSHGEPTMRNFGEYPKDAKESRLSQILETNPDPKYNLSPKACQGILRRANNRGKKLPELLERTLIQQSVCKETELIEVMNRDATVVAGEGGGSYTLNATDRHAICNQFPRESRETRGGKGILIQDERIGAMSTSANQYVCDPCREYRGGQVHDAISPSDEVCKTLNTMCDPMKVLVESGGAANHTPQVKPDFF